MFKSQALNDTKLRAILYIKNTFAKKSYSGKQEYKRGGQIILETVKANFSGNPSYLEWIFLLNNSRMCEHLTIALGSILKMHIDEAFDDEEDDFLKIN